MLLLAATAALTAACSSGTSSSGTSGTSADPITLDFMSYAYGQNNPSGQAVADMINQFNASHPTIQVKPQSVAVADVLTKLRTDAVAGTLPDVAQIGWSKIVEATQTLQIRPMDQIDPNSWRAHIAGVQPAVLNAIPKLANGRISTMPWLLATPMTFYNADLFRKAGLDPDKAPATMDDIRTAALALRKSGADAGAYFALADPGNSDYLPQSLVNGNGGALVTPAGQVTVDSPANVEAFTIVQDIIKSGGMPAIQYNDALSAFNAGKLGIFVVTAAVLPAAQAAAKGKFELRTAGFPAFPGKTPHPTFSGSGLSILSRDDAKAKAAWEFVQYLTNVQGATTATKQMGYLPLRPEAAAAANPLLRPATDQLATLTPYTVFPGKRANEAVVSLMQDGVAPIVLRNANPADTLKNVQAKIQSLAGN